MKQLNKMFSIVDLLIGVAIIIFFTWGTSSSFKCMDCSTWESWKGSIPMIVFGVLLATSSPLLWKETKTGKYFSIIVWVAGIAFVIISVLTTSVVDK